MGKACIAVKSVNSSKTALRRQGEIKEKVYGMKTDERLYHYTNWEGLWGILQTQCLWATNYRFMNDDSELLSFKKPLIEVLTTYFKKELDKQLKEHSDANKFINENGGLDAYSKHLAENWIENLYNVTGHEFYIASFCGEHNKYINENGLLSQWRGYGKDGGFALVFNRQKLDEILRLEAERFNSYYILGPVIYSDEEEKIYSEMSKIVQYVIKLSLLKMTNGPQQDPETPSSNLIKDTEKTLSKFFCGMSSYKHCGFREENEVRIFVWLQPCRDEVKQDKKLNFRPKNGEYVPYIEIFNTPDTILPIERIIVGPHKNKKARADTLSRILKTKSMNIDVTISDIPYIG